jgi:AbrB family looped-hinge helix DNA binding protein
MAWSTPSRERRVLKAGHSSIAVTLPKPWAEAMNLRPGDLIVFDQNDDGTLYLKPAPTGGTGGTSPPYLVQVHSFEAPGILERLIVGAYRVGHDAIEIRTEVAFSPERVEELHAAARGLLGVSVVAQEPNRVLLQNFIDPSKYGLPQLVQRMKMILVAFLDEIEEILQSHVRSRRLATLDEEGNKVLALLVRQLFLASRDWSLARRIGSPDPRHLLEWRVVVHSLQDLSRLFREATSLLNESASSLPGLSDSLVSFVPEIKAYLKEVMDALLHPTLERACEVHQAGIPLGEAALRATDRLKGAARRNGIFAASISLQRSTRCLSLLSEVAIDRAVSAGTETILADAA